MANTKVSALTELTTPVGADLFYVVDDPGGTPASKYVTLTNIAGNLPATSVTGDFTVASGAIVGAGVQAFSANDATPSVTAGNLFKTANAVATTVTDFDDGTDGQVIRVIINDANTTIDFTSSGLKGNGGADWSPTTGDWMECVYDGTDWYCSVHDCTA